MDRGFVIVAQDGLKATYLTCAEALAKSIKRTMPDARVSLITNNNVPDFEGLYDQVIRFPHGDQSVKFNNQFINDWQVYDASPYEYTIKLEADMYIPHSIDHWWDTLQTRDVVVSTHIRNFKQEVSEIKYYRKFIIDNKLPDCYNAITYYRKSDLARNFFEVVRTVFENWDEIRCTLKCNVDEPATTDWVYAIACHVLGVENTTLPQYDPMGMVHMKQFINGLFTDDWTDSLTYEILPHTMRINTIAQKYPVHYYNKEFANRILENL